MSGSFPSGSAANLPAPAQGLSEDVGAGYSHQPDPPPARAGKRRRGLVWAALAVPAIGWTALYAGAATPLKGALAREASAALNREVSIAGPVRILLTPLSVTISAADVRIANPAWARSDTLLDVSDLTARFATFDFLIGRAVPRALALRGGTLDLERSADGKAMSWADGQRETAYDLTAIRRLDADGVTLRYHDPARDAQARIALSAGGPGLIAMAGNGTVADERFAMRGTLETSESRDAAIDLNARMQGLSLALSGTAERPSALATARLQARAEGADFARLADLAGIALPAMPGYALSGQLSHAPQGWLFSRIEGRIGRTDISGKLTLDKRGARPRIVGRLASRQLDLADARALFGLHDAPLIEADALGPLAPTRARLMPDASLSPEALGQVDAVVDYSAAGIIGTTQAPRHLTMRLALVGGILQLSPASVDMAGGFVSSDLLVDARTSPALVRADIRLSPTPMGRLLDDWGIAPAGTTVMAKGRVELTGRGTTLREALGQANGRMALVIPGGEMRTRRASASALDMATLSEAMFRDEAQQATDVNCGLIAFTVRNGLASADPILIDTGGHVLSGSGFLDLRDESLNLRLQADGKRLAFFSRPNPLRIAGTLADPLVAREPIAWASPASFLGFTFPLPNLRAMFGFVDPDQARAPACGPLLRAAPAAAQRDREATGQLALNEGPATRPMGRARR
ncbi:AsmA family protein [Sphingobium sp. SYK-6]|uniref:AsmA family protein n=1 Tax=Sphingobium sp. (strain NBRC 103272 / SYK-6) TaxID=627192 RepID=UPI0002276656|nr:AsmA family protein [Sphingobium sp. SYK-6]BAK65085.1 AsmA family protein [Sphingobium sp. SYK-6]